jgi:hypothetical protein
MPRKKPVCKQAEGRALCMFQLATAFKPISCSGLCFIPEDGSDISFESPVEFFLDYKALFQKIVIFRMFFAYICSVTKILSNFRIIKFYF